ncbi:MAG: hypothetical protein H6566_19725 [Lewinellaceae bacterium]|nr:hypothetical protein [Lewinellaceae bacterium]
MEPSIQEKFLEKLEEKYGRWSKPTARFGNTSYGEIAKALSISASQFSKLIYGTATEGMYIRSIENINRLLTRETIREERDEAVAENELLKVELGRLQRGRASSRRRLLLMLLLVVFSIMAALYFYGKGRMPAAEKPHSYTHPLAAFFDKEYDANFNSPYLDILEVQEYCPCSAYEGVWSLSEQYKLPLPGTRKPGVYYVAKSADVRMKCSRYDTSGPGKGRVLMGYEYLINEIWVDTKMKPISPTYFDKDKKAFTPAFDALVFEQNPQFKKVATIHSFFIDKFEIYPDSIVRKGEPYGRYASDIDQKLADEYQIDIKFILEDVVGDMTTATCAPSPNLFCDPNDLKEKESVIAFDCLYTIRTENLGIGGGYPYTKGYRLEEQAYGDNLTCGCE